jgi:Ca2+-binding RTX toxin-like protein
MSDDLFVSTPDDELLDGGDGNDTVSYILATGLVTVHLGTGQASGPGVGVDTLVGIEAVIGSAFADRLTGSALADTLRGAEGNDTFGGGAGADRLYGEAGDDLLNGGTGDDLIDGGAGVDTASYTSAAAGVTVFLTTAQAQDTGGAGIDRLVGIEALIGSVHDDRLTGNSAANALAGGGGNDVLVGRDGDDRLSGGAGDDLLNGGGGTDTASYANAATAVTIDLRSNAAQDTGEGLDRLLDIENAVGSAHDDTLLGNDGANVLDGGAGRDLLSGGDAPNPDASVDVLIGGAGFDTVIYAGAVTGVQVSLAVTGVQDTGGGGRDALVQVEALFGSSFADVLTGDAGDNSLQGWFGSDVLSGGTGADRLNGGRDFDRITGGAGADAFIFADPLGSGNIDTITDFTPGEDRFELDHEVFAGLTPGALPEGTLGDRIVHEGTALRFLYTLDDGSTTLVTFAELSDGLTLTEDDFLVI